MVKPLREYFNDNLAQRLGEKKASQLHKWTDRFRILNLPRELRDKIYAYTLPTGSLVIDEFSYEAYETRFRRKESFHTFCEGKSKCMANPKATYFATFSNDTSRNMGMDMHILNICRQIRTEALETVYKQPVNIVGSYKAALAWFHDHLDHLPLMQTLTLHFRVEYNDSGSDPWASPVAPILLDD
ncbi:hypothetical protein M501DRAFT_196805 [Patellaria atrata CBS 101060]|uniref:2EXR domain-containing protein n=1 Tax=Patellaria atrata CBS 101060 TaxID=1346257 RepID=A0A9P4S8L3_9PEZI|nr:hypothetical protein M501DRAFT_196805 [Patellaria atrata CBS 101060]